MKTHPPSLGNPTYDPVLLDKMRRVMRRQALQPLAEADRLVALYTAVTGKKTTAVATTSNDKSDMGEF